MKFKISDAVKEAVKELFRVALLAVLPLLVVAVQEGSFDFRLVAGAGVVAVLRSVDKWLHESGVADKGLTRF